MISGPRPAWRARPTLVRKAVTSLVALLVASLGLAGSPAGASALVCNGKWHLQSVSDLHDEEFLQAVSAISVSDAWAVGSFADGTGPLTPLFQHWDGAAWSEVPGAALPDGLMSGSATVSSTDVWAVGGRQQTPPARTLTEHWDGSAWTVVPSPSPGQRSHGSWLHAVGAVSSTDVWAVGSRGIQDGDRTLAEHWDGSAWKEMPSGNALGMDSDILMATTAIAADDIWAVGYAYSNADFVGHTLTLHWDGTSWSVVPSPDATNLGDVLYGVSASSSTDVWAVGIYAGADDADHALTEHWDGTSWTVVPGADVGAGSFLFAVSAAPTGTAWAVGSYATGGPSVALTDVWNGSPWRQVQGISPGTLANQLHGVDALSAKSVFAVGWYNNADYHAHPITEYFC